MSRHASADDLACLAEDCLRPRKAARVQTHLSQCPQCTQLSNQLAAVPTMLASTSTLYPAMPDQLSTRLQTALATESGQRLASAAPSAEAARRDLPERAGPARRSWRWPSFSSPAGRVLATAGALVVIVGGGYEIASHAGSDTSQSSSGSAAELPRAQASQLSLGPNLTYGGHTVPARTIQTVTSDTDFVAGRLSAQAVAAVQAARLRGVAGAQHTAGTLLSPSATYGRAIRSSANGAAISASKLAGCLDLLAAGRAILLVDLARYEGRPATVIVAAATSSQPAEVWVVGDSCSASRRDVLDHRRLART